MSVKGIKPHNKNNNTPQKRKSNQSPLTVPAACV